MLSTTRLLAAAVVVVALCATARAFAADVVDPLNKREPARPGFLPPPPTAPFALPPVERKPLPPAAIGQDRKLVEKIVFHGNTAIPTEELDAVAAPYRGRLVGAAEGEELRQALTRHNNERGYNN